MLQDTTESFATAAGDKVLNAAPPVISLGDKSANEGISNTWPETSKVAVAGGRSELEADAAGLIALSSSVLSSLREVRQRRREEDEDVIFSKDELQVIWLLHFEPLETE